LGGGQLADGFVAPGGFKGVQHGRGGLTPPHSPAAYRMTGKLSFSETA
jgi:hypothetical protein